MFPFSLTLCIVVYILSSYQQMTDDMMAMKNRHEEMIKELEKNFLMASRENQVTKRRDLKNKECGALECFHIFIRTHACLCRNKQRLK